MIPSTQTLGRSAAVPKLKIPKTLSGQAPLTGDALHDAIRRIAGTMHTGNTNTTAAPVSPWDQAQQVVAAQLTPLEKQLTAGYTNQGAAGAAAIKALTAQYAAQMGQEPSVMSGIYGTAEQSNAAANDALANRVTGAGTGASDELAQRLASIQQPGAVNPVIAQLAGNATGSGNAVYAGGNAALEQLIGQGANAQTYAAKLPGIAKETGIQSLGQYEGQIGSAESAALSALEQKAPGLVQQAFGTIASANSKQASIQDADARASAANDLKQQTINQSAAKTKAALIIANGIDPATGVLTASASKALSQVLNVAPGTVTGVSASVAARVASDATKADLSQQTLNERVSHDKVSEAQAAARVQIAAANATTAAGRLELAKVTQAAKKGKGSGTLTENETEKLLTVYHDGTVKNVRVAAVDPATGQPVVKSGVPQYVSKSTVAGQLTYDQAVQRLVGLGKTKAEAQKAVNSVYAPGDAGRPWLTTAQTAVLAKTGPQVSATGQVTGTPGRGAHPVMMNGHAVLDPSQYAALKKAGMLPEGQLTAEGFYVIGSGS